MKMKKDFVLKFTSLGLALICGATFALSACGGEKGGDSETTPDPATEILTADPTPDTEKETFPIVTLPPEDDSVREPVDNPRAQMMVKYYYDLAMQVYNWAYVECMPITVDNGVDEDGDTYYPIVAVFETALLNDATIETYSDLTEYISEIFDKPIADVIISEVSKNYRDINGTLHCKVIETREDDESRGTMEEFLSKFSSNLFRYTVKETKTVDGDTSVTFHDYVFENTSYGWRFTSFPIVMN